MDAPYFIPQTIKLVIWDLDETFWDGTLTEGGAILSKRNINILKVLADRGIVSSICSKNSFEETKSFLERHKLWHWFVFPSISFDAKGPRIKAILDSMHVRPENTLFLDDNLHNLQEAKSSLPGLGVALPERILPDILSHSSAAGKNDSNLSRLGHYRSLESKYQQRMSFSGTNIEFLRDCDIQVKIDFDYEANLERILELLERTNQLNYTKKRISTPEDKAYFLQELEHFQRNCGVVFCRDKYGDHGAVGFYMVRTTYFGRFFDHFVFSCRAMNMGLESFVFQYLNCPELKVVQPVAYEPDVSEKVDWITLVEEFDSREYEVEDCSNILLLGPCNLLQASSFLGGTTNFLHTKRNNAWIRFDCPGFFLSPQEKVINSSFLEKNITWNKAEYLAFRQALKTHRNVVCDIFDFLTCTEIGWVDGVFFRTDLLDDSLKLGVVTEELSVEQRLHYLASTLDWLIDELSDTSTLTILLRVVNDKTPQEEATLRNKFASFMKQRKQTLHNVELIELTPLLDASTFNDGLHLNRSGYFKLAQLIKNYKLS